MSQKAPPPKKPFEIIPLRTGEATEIQLLWASRDIYHTPSRYLEKRLKACKRWSQFCAIRKWMDNIIDDLMETIDLKRRYTFLLNLRNQEIRVVSKNSIRVEPGYTIIPSQVLSDIIVQAMTDTCMICNGEGCDMAKCRFRKSIKQTMMFDIDESGGVCMGKTLLEMLEKEE